MDEDRKAVSDILKEIEEYEEADTVTLFELKTILHDRGFGVFMLLLALPLTIPLPTIPVHTPIVALPLALFSIQILMGRSTPWLPYFWDKKSFKRESLTTVIKKTSPLLKAMERWTKPRAMFIFCGAGKRVAGLICLLCALSIAIPLPLTNSIPATGICAIALGMLNRDGVLVVFGMVLGFLGILNTALILIVGPKLIMETLPFVSRLFAEVPRLGTYSTMAASISVLMVMYLFTLIIVCGRINAAADHMSKKADSLVAADFALSHSLMLCLQNSIERRTGRYIDDATSNRHPLDHGTSDVFMSLTEAAEHIHSDKPCQDRDHMEFGDNDTYLTDVCVTSAAPHSKEQEDLTLEDRSSQRYNHSR